MSSEIKIQLTVSSQVINAEAMSKICDEVRYGIANFIAEAVNAVAQVNDLDFNHSYVSITGSIEVKQ